jgi:hypothetical protein
LGGKWPEIVEAVDPSLIKWTNLGVKKVKRRFYTCLTDFLGLILVMITLYALAYLTKLKVESKQIKHE